MRGGGGELKSDRSQSGKSLSRQAESEAVRPCKESGSTGLAIGSVKWAEPCDENMTQEEEQRGLCREDACVNGGIVTVVIVR